MADGKNEEGKHVYTYFGSPKEAAQQYEYFRRCLPQLIDPDSLEGDLTGRYVIFKDGWVLPGSYDTARDAANFAVLIHREDQRQPGFSNTTYIIAQVGVEHALSPLHLLGAALADLEFATDEPPPEEDE